MPPIERLNRPETSDLQAESGPQPDAPVPTGVEPETAAETKPRSSSRNAKTRSQKSRSTVASLALTVCVAGSLCFAAWGAYRLLGMARTYVAGQERYCVALREIEITPPPPWIGGDLLSEVRHLAALPDVVNTLDDKLAEELHAAFSMHPWVRDVVEVRVARPSQIRVKLTYREPVAAVHTTRLLVAVDRDGVLLPSLGMPDPQVYLMITGVRSTPNGPAGTKWDDAALAAGIAVADALSPRHRTLGITTIDVGGFRPGSSNPGSIFLLTEQGTRVKWGRPPNANYPGEVPLQDKIDRLAKYAADNGSLDAPAGPYDIDITHWQEISLRPRNQTPTKNR